MRTLSDKLGVHNVITNPHYAGPREECEVL